MCYAGVISWRRQFNTAKTARAYSFQLTSPQVRQLAKLALATRVPIRGFEKENVCALKPHNKNRRLKRLEAISLAITYEKLQETSSCQRMTICCQSR